MIKIKKDAPMVEVSTKKLTTYKVEIKLYGNLKLVIYKDTPNAHIAYLEAIEEVKSATKESLLEGSYDIKISEFKNVEEDYEVILGTIKEEYLKRDDV